jgi:hypothetical protein
LASVGARQSALVKARFTLYGDAKPPCGGKFRRASGHKPGALTRAARRGDTPKAAQKTLGDFAKLNS